MPVVTNWGEAILTALTNALNLLLTFIPKFLGFLVILFVGLIVASLLSKAVIWLLRKVGFDNMANRIGLTRLEQRMGLRLDPAGILGKIVYWFVFLILLVPATDALGLTAVSTVMTNLLNYIPNVFVAILVLFLGTLAATFVSDIVRGATASANVGNANVFATIAKWAIIGFASLIALEQLQIAPSLMTVLFTAIVGALALAFGLAFGLGGQESARRWLARSESTVSNLASQVSAQQPTQPQNVEEMRAEQMRIGQMRAEHQARMEQMQAQQPPPTGQPQYGEAPAPDQRTPYQG